MKNTICTLPLLAFLVVVASIFIAGCSDSTTSTEVQASPSVAAVATTVSQTALYSAGDIVKNPKSTAASGLLILGYDVSTDTYERAYIYPNSDGSWGYRLDSKTEKITRSTIENVYSQKAGTVEVSAIPVGKPTTAAVAPTATKTTAVTTTATATATTASAAAPKITDIDPDRGATGTTVSITSLEGKNFVSGANVSLVKSGETTIIASSVSVTSPEEITCTFAIPSTAGTGFWDVVITNPDKQTYTWKTGFSVTQGTTTTTTTSTGSSTTIVVTVISASPMTITSGGAKWYGEMRIIGTNLSSVKYLKLVNSLNTFTGVNYYPVSSQEAQTPFDIPSGSQGTYTLTATDANGVVLGTLKDPIIIQ